MFDFIATDNQRTRAWRLIRTKNYARRGRFDGGDREQYFGKLGEIIFADMYGLKDPNGDGFDGGIDFTLHGKNIDLKTLIGKVPHRPQFGNNLAKMQVDAGIKTDIYCFCYVNSNTNVYTFIGAIDAKTNLKQYLWSKGDEKKRADDTVFTFHCDTYEIPTDILTPVNNPDELYWVFDKM